MRHGYEDTGSIGLGTIAAGVVAGALLVGGYVAYESQQGKAPSANAARTTTAGHSAVASANLSPTAMPSSESASSSPVASPTAIPTFPSYGVAAPSTELAPTSSVPVASPSETVTPTAVVPAPTPSRIVVAPKPKPPVRAPIIALDPGHSGSAVAVVDPISHLRTNDYENLPEIDEMFTVATIVENSLEHDGYKVVMLKAHARDTVSLSTRAINAMKAHADLAVSIHDDHSQQYGQGNDVYPQKVGLYREQPDGSGRYTCNNAHIAKLSQQYSNLMARTRAKAQGLHINGGPSDVNTSYLNRSGLYPGNLAMVQLTTCNGGTVKGKHLSPVPWVYDEMGAKRQGSTTLKLTHGMLVAYAKGITAGIEAAVPVK